MPQLAMSLYVLPANPVIVKLMERPSESLLFYYRNQSYWRLHAEFSSHLDNLYRQDIWTPWKSDFTYMFWR